MVFDLSKALKPVVVRSSFLGTVEVEARKQSFYDWFRKARDQKRWVDPYAFVRSLLLEQTSLRSTGQPPGKKQIDSLTTRQLNAFANALVKAAGFLIAPRGMEDARGKLRQRQVADPSLVERRAGERASTHLFRLLMERDEEQRTIERERAAELKKIIEGPVNWLRRLDPMGDQIEKLRREVLGRSLLSQLTGASTVGTELTRLQAKSFAQAEEISRAVDRAAGVGTFYTSALRQRELLASQLADRTSIVSRARDTIGSIMGASSATDRFLQAEMTRQRMWGESIKQFLNPGLSHGLLASMMGAQQQMSVSDAIEAAAGLSRGFRTAANLGLAGIAPRGAASEVLRQYNADFRNHSHLFREVMTGIQRFDVENLCDEELSEGLNKARETARGIDLTDPAQVQMVLALITLLLMVYATILQQDAIEIARSSATSGDVAAATAEMKGLRDDLRRAREEDRIEWRDIRFVVDVTPLRAEPDRGSAALLEVYPDQLLRIREVKGSWARVEVIPYSTGEPASGWIDRRRLRASPT